MEERGSKRRARDEIDYDRPHRRSRGEESRQPRQLDAPPEQRDAASRLLKLRTHIIRLADKLPGQEPPNVDEQLELLSNALSKDISEFSEADFHEPLLEVLMQCAEELPNKTPFYACLVGLLNVKNFNFCKGVVVATFAAIQTALDKDDLNRLRVQLRFLACLMACNVVSGTGLLECFGSLVAAAAAAVDDETGNTLWQSRGDFYVFCVLAALPFCGPELQRVAKKELEVLLDSLRAYMNTRTKLAEPALQVFEKTREGKSTVEEEDYLEDLWSRTGALLEANWELKAVPRPQAVFHSEHLSNAEQHSVPSLVTPALPPPPEDKSAIAMDRERHQATQKYPPPRARLQIFPTEKAAADMSPMDQFIVEEYLHDILFFLNGCRKECASYMVTLPVQFRYDYLMAEVVFGEMLLLPQPPFRLIYYTVVLVDLCKSLPNSFPAVVAGAIRGLFERVQYMDVECRARFEQWFAHHLSNFTFVWPWGEWAHVLDMAAWAPQRLFCHEVLEREVRLSYWDKVKDSVPERFVQLLPPKPVPFFKYGTPKEQGGVDPSAPEVELSNELVGLIRGKKTCKEVLKWLEEKVTPTHGPQGALDIFATTLLQVGSKTFTHMVTMLERYQPVITRLVPTSDTAAQAALVSLVASFWRNSSQMTAVVVDRMMGLRIVSNLAIVEWVFSPEPAATFHVSGLVWEVLSNAMDKTSNRVKDLRKSVAELQAVADKASQAVAAAEAEAAESGEQAEEESARPKAKVARLKEDEESASDAVAAKQALLSRAVVEQESLLMSVFKKITAVVEERLPALDAAEREAKERAASQAAANVDAEMDEADTEESGSRRRRAIAGGEGDGLSEEDEEARQWILGTLSHLRALSRRYAPQIWPLMERLEEQVFSSKVDRRIKDAAFSGLQRTFL